MKKSSSSPVLFHEHHRRQMIRIQITGRNPFLCPVGWTVEQAEWKIRSSYEVTDGHVEKYGIPMSVDETLTLDGDYRFVNFRSLQGKVLLPP